MLKEITVNDFITRFEAYAPKAYAEEGDPVGLHFGSKQQIIHKMMVTLDVRPEVVDEAITNNVDFIFAHHPPIFKPVARLDSDNPQNAMYHKLIQNQIAVYAAHSNLDAAPDGMNDWLAERYLIENPTVLSPYTAIKAYRITTYIPEDAVETLHEKVVASGYSDYANYKGVHFRINGTGGFTPIADANPTIGQLNQPERVEEVLYTVTCMESDWQACEALIKANHPYEVPVVDVVELTNFQQLIGLGRIGDLKEPMSVTDYIAYIKKVTGISGLRAVLADPDRMVKRVAVLGGDGGKFYPDALSKEADMFITGDIYYHTAHDMLADGLNAIDPGHHFESICKEKLQEKFQTWKESDGWKFEIIQSQLNTDPFTFK